MQFCENKQVMNFIFQDFDFDFKDISEETDSEMIEMIELERRFAKLGKRSIGLTSMRFNFPLPLQDT